MWELDGGPPKNKKTKQNKPTNCTASRESQVPTEEELVLHGLVMC